MNVSETRTVSIAKSFLLPSLVPSSLLAIIIPRALFFILFVASIYLAVLRLVWRRKEETRERGTIWTGPLTALLCFPIVILISSILSPILTFALPPVEPNSAFPTRHPSLALAITSQVFLITATFRIHLFLIRLVFPPSTRTIPGSGSRLYVPLNTLACILIGVDLVWRAGFVFGQLRGEPGLDGTSGGNGRTAQSVAFVVAMAGRALVLVICSVWIVVDLWMVESEEGGGTESEEELSYQTLEWGILVGNFVGLGNTITSFVIPLFSESPLGHILLSLQAASYLVSISYAIITLPLSQTPTIPSSKLSDSQQSTPTSLTSIHDDLPTTRITPPTPRLASPPQSLASVQLSRPPSPFFTAGDVHGPSIYQSRTGGLGRTKEQPKRSRWKSAVARLGSSFSSMFSSRESDELPMQDRQVDPDLEGGVFGQQNVEEWEERMNAMTLKTSTFDAFSMRSTTKMEPRIPPRLGRKVTQPPTRKAVPRESFASSRGSTGFSSIGAGMFGLSGEGSAEEATLLNSEFLLDRPPSIYTPDRSFEAYSLKYLFLANPDASSPPSDSTLATRASSPSSYFAQPPSQASSRYSFSINNPTNRRISRIPNFSRSSIAARLSASSPPPPLPPPSVPVPLPPTRPDYPYPYQASPIASWGSASDAYTFILPAKSLDAPSGPSTTNASSTLATSDLLIPSAFPESPLPPSPSNLDHNHSSSTPTPGDEVDEDSFALESKLPQLPPLTHKSSRSATRFEEFKLGGKGGEGKMWLDSNGMAGGVKARGLSRSGTMSSTRTNGSRGFDAEYEALEAYMEGRSWAK